MSTAPGDGPSPERVPDELLAAARATGDQLNTLIMTAYAKGMRDGLDVAARLTTGAADEMRDAPSSVIRSAAGLLDVLSDQFRLTAFELPDPGGARSDG